MLDIWYLIIGIVFGIISSLYAKKKNMHAENWFTLGLIFWFIAPLIIFFTNIKNDALKKSEDEEFSFPH